MKKNIMLLLVLTFCLMFTSVSMAESNLTDINNTKYEEAVSNLINSDVVNGYPDNTYRPDGAITRAEMTKMIIIATDNEGGDPLVNVSFTDIDNSNHWAKENIYAAASLGIVNGYPDNTFKPDGNVTYAEATAMVVRAMGNDDEVRASSEAWPNNYISYAQSLNLYNDIDNFNADDNATRGNIALLLWNMLKMGNTLEDNTTTDDAKILIAFFSRADENYSVGTVEVGNTEIMAGFMEDYLGDKADTFKIDPVVKYPDSYEEVKDVATREKNENARPEFDGNVDISKYDTIFIGYPIWYGDTPMIINTFLEKYDFSGKTIIPFNTHEGSGNSGTYNYIKNKMTSSDVNTNGLAIRGSDAREESSRITVENWLKGLGY